MQDDIIVVLIVVFKRSKQFPFKVMLNLCLSGLTDTIIGQVTPCQPKQSYQDTMCRSTCLTVTDVDGGRV